MTLAEFLRWNDGTDARYELVGGRIVSMAPPNDAHGTMTVDLAVALANAVRPPCRVAAEAATTAITWPTSGSLAGRPRTRASTCRSRS
jgi:Uma2 family endonuclease